MSKSKYCKPDGKGSTHCMEFEDFLEYGWVDNKATKEEEPILVYPDCLRKNRWDTSKEEKK